MLRYLGFILGAVRSHGVFGTEKTEVLIGADSTHLETLQLRIPDGRLSILSTVLPLPQAVPTHSLCALRGKGGHLERILVGGVASLSTAVTELSMKGPYDNIRPREGKGLT